MELDVVIRPAVSDEWGALEALARRASLANPGDREAVEAHPDMVILPAGQIDEGQVFVAESSGQLLGYAAVLPRPDGDGELDGLFVDPAAWRRGLGRLLVRRCVAATRAAGGQALHVVGNPHAEAFYRRCGFVTYGEVDTPLGGRGLLMRVEV